MASRIYSTSGVNISHNLIYYLPLGRCGSCFTTVEGKSFIGHPPSGCFHHEAPGWKKLELLQDYISLLLLSLPPCGDILSCCPTCRSHSPAYKSKDKLPLETLRCSHPKSMIHSDWGELKQACVRGDRLMGMLNLWSNVLMKNKTSIVLIKDTFLYQMLYKSPWINTPPLLIIQCHGNYDSKEFGWIINDDWSPEVFTSATYPPWRYGDVFIFHILSSSSKPQHKDRRIRRMEDGWVCVQGLVKKKSWWLPWRWR